jgi:hypothetical protein
VPAFACEAPGSGVVVFSVSITFVFMVFLLGRVAVVTSITQLWRKTQVTSAMGLAEDQSDIHRIRAIGGTCSFLIGLTITTLDSSKAPKALHPAFVFETPVFRAAVALRD